MANEKLPEYWQRGPVENIPALLQPAAHAILQARDEVNALVKDFPDDLLWVKPAGAASAGFHLQHLTGVLDRLYTYAKGNALTDEQRASLNAEGDPEKTNAGVAELLQAFNKQVDLALQQLSGTEPQTLTEFRGIGRAQLPSTVMGLLFHAAEHTMRHLGQLIVTVRVVRSQS